MARLKTASTRQRVGLVQEQNLRAPGGLAERSAMAYARSIDSQFVGFGPDSRRREWSYGLGHDLMAAKVPMHDIVDGRWQDVGVRVKRRKR